MPPKSTFVHKKGNKTRNYNYKKSIRPNLPNDLTQQVKKTVVVCYIVVRFNQASMYVCSWSSRQI